VVCDAAAGQAHRASQVHHGFRSRSAEELHKCEISCSEAARQYLARILKWSVPHGPTFSLKTNYYIIFYRDRNVSNISALHKRYVAC
jgi:hypothetical protein